MPSSRSTTQNTMLYAPSNSVVHFESLSNLRDLYNESLGKTALICWGVEPVSNKKGMLRKLTILPVLFKHINVTEHTSVYKIEFDDNISIVEGCMQVGP
jgi:hypothetical protein